jgi:hypothetical protein
VGSAEDVVAEVAVAEGAEGVGAVTGAGAEGVSLDLRLFLLFLVCRIEVSFISP